MPKMIDLIRQSAVPASVMRSAARGALSLPTGEMIEILVYLTSNPVFAEQAKMTLAGWDEPSSIATASDPTTPWEVLSYLISPENLRPKLLPALLENSSIRESVFIEMAPKASREIMEIMLRSQRVKRSAHILHALLPNPNLKETETQQLYQTLRSLGEETTKIMAYQEAGAEEKTQYEIEHADEIAAAEAENSPFEIYGQDDELEDLEHLEALTPADEVVAEAKAAGGAAAGPAEFEIVAETTPAGASAQQDSIETVALADPATAQAGEGENLSPAAGGEEESDLVRLTRIRDAQNKSRERLTSFQKIARMGVRERIQLAVKGTKEERFILIRDGARLVSSAVLNSPKLSEPEVEQFANMKNVSDTVLREISRSHKFMKNYNVIRNLVNNPRSPLDLSLALVNHLTVGDLKSLSSNKNVADTLRKLAMKRFKDKTEVKRGG
ncbi:MAG TPA: hypothetical protein VK738_08175 [Terriglobales bacterium]|jgi:hypothetical protein|nr:hypothetical protein [Terriglobales bacterium]